MEPATSRNQAELWVPKEQLKNAVLEEIRKIFPAGASNLHDHNYYTCGEQNCNKLSEAEVLRFLSNRTWERFVHSWLGDESLSFCQTTGIFWLVYEEGQGMYCFLCKKHNTENAKNKSIRSTIPLQVFILRNQHLEIIPHLSSIRMPSKHRCLAEFLNFTRK